LEEKRLVLGGVGFRQAVVGDEKYGEAEQEGYKQRKYKNHLQKKLIQRNGAKRGKFTHNKAAKDDGN